MKKLFFGKTIFFLSFLLNNVNSMTNSSAYQGDLQF